MLELEPEAVDPLGTFTSLGLDSTALLELTGDLSTWLDRELSTSLVWEYTTIQSLAAHLAASDEDADELALAPVGRGILPPLTFSQERSWRQFQVQGPDARQAMKIGLELRGALDEKILDWCLTEIVRRHEILRTNFKDMGDGAVQVIHPAPVSTLHVEDCSLFPDPLAHAWSKDAVVKKTVLDLADGPLTSFTLYRLGPEDYRLLLRLNHILADEVSKQVLKGELYSLYRWKSNGSDSPPPELEIQVGDFAWWQRKVLDENGPIFQKQLAWWCAYHKKAAPLAPAFSFRWQTPPESGELSEGLVSAAISQRTYHALQQLAASENATPMMVLLTAFFFVLAKYTGQSDLLVGNYVSERRRPKVYSLIGYFINLVVLRSPNLEGRSFLEAVGEVRSSMEQIVAHQDLPFETLCETLSKQNCHPPYPSLMYQHIKVTPANNHMPGVTVSGWVEPTQAAQSYWGFTFKTTESGGELSAEITFDSSLYVLPGVQDMLRDYTALLEEVAEAYASGA